MKVLIIDAPRRLRIEEAAVPEPGPNEVLIRVKCCGLCGTDVNIYNGLFPWAMPARFGHEFSGEVAAVGSHVEGFAPGDRVVGENHIGCGDCDYCKKGRYNLCEVAPRLFNAFAEYIVTPARSVFKIGTELDFDVAALLEPLAVAYSATARAEVRAGGNLAILGDGAIGLCSLLMAKAKGVSKVFMTGLKPHKLELAMRLGANAAIDVSRTNSIQAILDETNGEGADSTLATTGWRTMIRDSMKLTRIGGTICVIGLYHGEEPAVIDEMDFIFREQTIRGSFASPNVWPDVIRMLQAGQIDPRPLIAHKFPIEQADEAFQTALDDTKKPVKVILAMGD
ncbi:MAG: alcohol dehydrogenase catalytic domain-containing protein [Armatimonadetes bacterium]|nr:alcohol dehydrogenase catalytic domain-containing protein [Armatimonadota bacterium]